MGLVKEPGHRASAGQPEPTGRARWASMVARCAILCSGGECGPVRCSAWESVASRHSAHNTHCGGPRTAPLRPRKQMTRGSRARHRSGSARNGHPARGRARRARHVKGEGHRGKIVCRTCTRTMHCSQAARYAAAVWGGSMHRFHAVRPMHSGSMQLRPPYHALIPGSMHQSFPRVSLIWVTRLTQEIQKLVVRPSSG